MQSVFLRSVFFQTVLLQNVFFQSVLLQSVPALQVFFIDIETLSGFAGSSWDPLPRPRSTPVHENVKINQSSVIPQILQFTIKVERLKGGS